MAKRTAKKRVKTIELDPTPDLELLTPPLDTTLDDLIGQPHALDTLDTALASRRIHHAWIFHGPPGVGKFTAALAFAAVLLDPDAAPDLAGRLRADPASPVQSLLRTGAHPDLHVIRKELARFSDDKDVRASKLTTIAKDVIESRLLLPAARAASLPGGLAAKVFIIDEAELLDRSPSNAATQNSMLKTLEEPPEGTVIILVTSSEDRLLPTIRSRAQRVRFDPLPEPDMQRWVDRRIAAGDDPGPHARWLLEYAAGSPGRYLDALETGLATWHERLAPGLARADRGEYDPFLSPLMRDLVETWAKNWVGKDDKRSKEAANTMALARLFSMIGDHARARLADPRSARIALGMIDAIANAERLLRANVSVALVMDGLAAQLPVRSTEP